MRIRCERGKLSIGEDSVKLSINFPRKAKNPSIFCIMVPTKHRSLIPYWKSYESPIWDHTLVAFKKFNKHNISFCSVSFWYEKIFLTLKLLYDLYVCHSFLPSRQYLHNTTVQKHMFLKIVRCLIYIVEHNLFPFHLNGAEVMGTGHPSFEETAFVRTV
jgi:hypothetical protein